MRHKNLIWFILSGFLLSCGSPAKRGGLVMSSDSVQVIIHTDSLHRFDTILFKGHKVVFSPLKREDYEVAGDRGFTPTDALDDSLLLARYKDNLNKSDSSFLILCKGGKKVRLISTPGKEMDDTLYGFKGQMKNSPYFVFQVDYYEACSHLLVNFLSGKSKEICGEPVLSPEENKMACISVYGIGQPITTYLELYTVGKDSLSLRFEGEFDHWVPDEIKWIDNNTLFIKQSTIADPGREIVSYARVQLID
jgi:hypothetical protein